MIDRNPDIQNYLPYRFRHPSGNTFNLGDAYHYSISYPLTHCLEDYTIVFVMDRLHANIQHLLSAYSSKDSPDGTVKPMSPMHARVLRSFFGPIAKEMTSKEVALAILQSRQIEVCESMGAKLPKRRPAPAAETKAKPAEGEEAKPKKKSLAERRLERLAELTRDEAAAPVPPPAGLTVEALERARRALDANVIAPGAIAIDPIAAGIARQITDPEMREATLRNLTTGQEIRLTEPGDPTTFDPNHA